MSVENSKKSQTPHKVKKGYEVRSGKATFYVWECICGASSALHQTQSAANESYQRHKDSVSSPTKGTER